MVRRLARCGVLFVACLGVVALGVRSLPARGGSLPESPAEGTAPLPKALARLAADLGELPAREGMRVEPAASGTLRLCLSARGLFEPDEARLLDDGAAFVTALTQILSRHRDVTGLIRVHTDRLGAEADNQAFSLQRAQVLRAALLDAGLDPNALGAVGVGGQEPLAQANSPLGRIGNRRVEFLFSARR